MSSVTGIILGVLLIGCYSPVPASSPTQMSSLQAEAPVDAGQKLPISARIIIAGRTIELEVAKTQQQQAIGLMFRTALPDNRGMLFTFEPPQPTKFWMKNTLIPLDMVFLRNGKVEAIAASVPPCTQEPCPTYGPDTAIDQVIELRAGQVAALGLQVGETLKINFLNPQRSRP